MFLQKLSKKMQIYLQIFYIQVLMQTSIAPAFKKGKKNLKTILDQLVSCVMFRRYLKDVFSDRYQIVWVTSYQNINVDF